MRVVNVSPHVLMDVSACGTRGWVRHVKGYTSSGDMIRAKAGQAIHASVAIYLTPGVAIDQAATAALAEFHRLYDPAFLKLPPEKLDESLTPQNLHRVLARWIEMHPYTSLPWTKVLLVEEAFISREWLVQTIAGETVKVRLIVRPDVVVEDVEGRVRWVDTKTTGWRISDPGWRQELRLSSQVQLYSDAVAQRFADRAVLGGWVSAMELRKLPSMEPPKPKKDGTPGKPRTCTEHNRPYMECANEHAKAEFIECLTTPERVARAVADAEEAAREYVALLDEENILAINMRGASRGSCRFCPAGNWCETSRPVAALSTWNDLMYEPYPVEEGQRAA